MGGSSETKTSLPDWALPLAGSLIGSGAAGVYGPDNALSKTQYGNMPILPFNRGLEQRVAGFTPGQRSGMDSLTGAVGPSTGLAKSGVDQLMSTLQGKYLDPDSNPYQTATFNRASEGLVNQYQRAIAPGLQAQAMQGGIFGGSAESEQRAQNQFDLGTNLADLANQIYGGNYQAERGNQLAAGQMIPGAQAALLQPGQTQLDVGTLQQGQEQTELDATRTNAELAQEWPFKVLSWLGNFMNTVTGGGGKVEVGATK